MDIAEGTLTKVFTCAGLTLKIGQPFEDEHICTAFEAAALNQLLVENMRNNFNKQCEKMQNEKAPHESIQSAFDAAVNAYTFGARRGRTVIIDPVKREAFNLAKERVVEKLKNMPGKKLADFDTETINAYAEAAVEQHPMFMEQAQRIVDERNALDSALELDLDIE